MRRDQKTKGPRDQGTGDRNAMVPWSRSPEVSSPRASAVLWSLCLLVFWFLGPLAISAKDDRPTVIVLSGAQGDPAFASDFDLQLRAWTEISSKAEARHMAIGTEPESGRTDRERLQQLLASEPREGAGGLWLVLIGHGTFDGREAKFNLRGPDISADDLAGWLKPFRRPLAVILTSSASAPFMAKLSAPGRIIVTATRSGYEQNYARFGRYLAEALPDPRSDLDKDGQISLLEAFLGASHRTTEFYRTDGRLATEHPLIDDNGDGLGTPADWFKGVRAVKRSREGVLPDGARAHQFHLVRSQAEQELSPDVRARRDELEIEVARLREAKPGMPEEDYLRQLERLMLELAALYDRT